jgi:hypothetical protein
MFCLVFTIICAEQKKNNKKNVIAGSDQQFPVDKE